jgi:hypothetical protein
VLTGIAKKTRRLVNASTALLQEKHDRAVTGCVRNVADAGRDVSVVAKIGSRDATQIAELVCEMNVLQCGDSEWVGVETVRDFCIWAYADFTVGM